MTALAGKLDTILQERQTRAKVVERLIQQWGEVRIGLAGVSQALKDASTNEDMDLAVSEAWRRVESSTSNERIGKLEVEAQRILDRFSRETINIGMSGVARVGKSTLLQTISGLDDRQIPTGEGPPVTAVRSQIFNKKGIAEAQISFFSWSRFRSEVLQPLHDQLHIGVTPPTLEDWRRFDYQAVAVDSSSGQARSNWNRCVEMQASIDSFAGEFEEGSKVVAIDEISRYVAYPQESTSTDRPYVAVESIRIYCEFPHLDATKFGLVDLPGLGEISPKAEDRHREALASSVDMVLLVVRPDQLKAFWGTEAGQVYELVQDARGAVTQSSDFCAIVHNYGGMNERLVESLRDSLRKTAPEVTIFEVDAADPDSVNRSLLTPVLEHLHQRLPHMDAEIWNALIQDSKGLARQLLTDVEHLRSALAAPTLASSAARHLDELTEDASLTLASGLNALENELLDRSMNAEDEEFIAEVLSAYDLAVQWIDGAAFPEGAEENILKRMQRAGGSPAVLQEELNRIRVDVSEYFSGLDSYFNKEVRELAARVRQELANSLGELVPITDDPVGDLRRFADLVESGDEPAAQFADSLREFTGTTFSYRMSLYPEVREVVNSYLQVQWVNPDTGQSESIRPFPVTSKGAEDLIHELRTRAHQVAFNSKQELLTRAQTPARLMHAVTERLSDRLLRGEQWRPEFNGVARSYRDTIWPGEFDSFLATRRSSANLRSSVKGLEETLQTLAGEQ